MKIYSAQLKGTTTVATGSNVSLTGSFTGSIYGFNDTLQYSSSVDSRIVVNSSRLNNIESTTASFSPRVSNLENKSASVDISISNINSFTSSNANTSLNSLTGSLATTGSNTFFGTQTFSGSVYIANNLVVQGSSSIQYISASSVSIGTNIVQLNTANPSVRFAGLTMIDSGSIGGSGSFLYDSVHDEFIFVHRGNGTNITSSHFVLGPETYDSLGNETYLTTNILPKGTGKEHLVDSTIFDNGTTVCVNANLKVTGTACFSSTITAESTLYAYANTNYFGCASANALSIYSDPNDTFIYASSTSTNKNLTFYTNNTNNRLSISNLGAVTIACGITANDISTFNGPQSNWAVVIQNTNSTNGYSYGLRIKAGTNCGSDATFVLQNYAGCEFLTARGYGSVGIGTTSPNVSSPLHVKMCSNSNGDGIRIQAFCSGAAGSQPGIAFANVCDSKRYSISLDNSNDILQITNCAGINSFQINQSNIACFAGQICAPSLMITNSVKFGTITAGTPAQFSFNSTVGTQTTANLTDSGNRCGILEIIAQGGEAGQGSGIILGADTWGGGNGRGQIAIKALLINGSGCGTSDMGFSLRNSPTCSNFTERMRITVDGNLGVGTGGPSAKLHVYSNTSCLTAPTMFLHQFDGNGQGYGHITSVDKNHGLIMRGTPTSYLNFGVAAGDQMSFFEYGDDFRFYRKTDANDMQLQVQFSGGVIYARTTAVQSLSDIRTKENIRNSEEGLNIITCLRPVRFDFKEGYSDGKKNQLGFIAQEVEEIFPDAVSIMKTNNETESCLKTMGPGTLIPVLVKAIQEQQCTINTLKSCLGIN